MTDTDQNLIIRLLSREDCFPDIVGQGEAKKQLSSALIAGRNIVIVGPPGIGKTTLAKGVAKLLKPITVNSCPYHCRAEEPLCPECMRAAASNKRVKQVTIPGSMRFVRIQGSPDLTAEDMLGDIDPLRALRCGPLSPEAFTPGKIFKANNGVLFFDELNRCPEKLQNAMLQVLEERKVTIGSYDLDFNADFTFIGTMNLADSSTERLSDVFFDRFDIVYMGYPENDFAEIEIVERYGKRLADMPADLLALIVGFVRLLRQNERLEKHPSVRVSIGIYERSQANALLEGRHIVSLDDIKEAVTSVVCHRIRLKPSFRYMMDAKDLVEAQLKSYLETRKGSRSSEPEKEGDFKKKDNVTVRKLSEAYEIQGKLSKNKGLMHTVYENDRSLIDDGKVIADSFNYNAMSFNPDLLFEGMTKNYAVTRRLVGETIIRLLSDYDPEYIGRNISIPEFRRELYKNIKRNTLRLASEGLIKKGGEATERGVDMASVALCFQELEKIAPDGFGEWVNKERRAYGIRNGSEQFRKQRYRDIDIKRSINLAVRRGHKGIERPDLVGIKRAAKGDCSVVYALDASGSMTGEKLAQCKKAGVALAYTAIQRRDKVGILVFGPGIKAELAPTDDFYSILREIVRIRASRETDIAKTVRRAISIFPRGGYTKHLLIITDAMPTAGDKPEHSTLKAVSAARDAGVTISVVGIGLNEEGRKLAERITELGSGRIYVAKGIAELDTLVLEDYNAEKKG
ncbi:hypothetical protein COT48_01340 [Candidatus Woesearchaeota archaeon CG08_land_8_20_14_0_20_47_9]|nr:MAG: hypothetical protein AUJ69_04455 [Candidatus Woesearchaeota archaeon CG1_02_47_18]PIO04276.1 MAG: hypothetical protein COT48_01340 [Candidatus Woesearchaeota archaeon CG08_land_8_20_14_0_20_47_9]HII30356.1 AAA domain-containing protein [Candidatus Woesearchaeota archaeon]